VADRGSPPRRCDSHGRSGSHRRLLRSLNRKSSAERSVKSTAPRRRSRSRWTSPSVIGRRRRAGRRKPKRRPATSSMSSLIDGTVQPRTRAASPFASAATIATSCGCSPSHGSSGRLDVRARYVIRNLLLPSCRSPEPGRARLRAGLDADHRYPAPTTEYSAVERCVRSASQAMTSARR
jgi:hypothetical protein